MTSSSGNKKSDLYSSSFFADNGMSEMVLSVSEFLDVINSLISIQTYQVQGEITSVDVRGSNIFLNLRDKLDGSILNCYCHESRIKGTGIQLRQGLEVRISGKAGIYKLGGRFSFNIQKINPVGEGELKQAYERLKAELDEKGYFDEERKKEIPKFPEKIALITSVNAAAKKDFLTHLSDFNFKVYFIDVKVEGLNSEDEVADAIRQFNESSINPDVIVVTRGGGSLESLQAFNTERVAKAIYSSRIPVISAIGHEQDILISDLVADLRASTPTDAAKILSRNWELARASIDQYGESIIASFRKTIRNYKDEIENDREEILYSYKNLLKSKEIELSRIKDNILLIFKQIFSQMENTEKNFMYNFRDFTTRLRNADKEVSYESDSLNESVRQWLLRLEDRFKCQDDILKAVDPEKRLKQGYSIVRNMNGKVIKSIKDVNINESINVKLYEGSLETIINKTQNNEQQ